MSGILSKELKDWGCVVGGRYYADTEDAFSMHDSEACIERGRATPVWTLGGHWSAHVGGSKNLELRLRVRWWQMMMMMVMVVGADGLGLVVDDVDFDDDGGGGGDDDDDDDGSRTWVTWVAVSRRPTKVTQFRDRLGGGRYYADGEDALCHLVQSRLSSARGSPLEGAVVLMMMMMMMLMVVGGRWWRG